MEPKKETRGGFRENARRPLKYGEKTERMVFQVPVSYRQRVADAVQKILKKAEANKSSSKQ